MNHEGIYAAKQASAGVVYYAAAGTAVPTTVLGTLTSFTSAGDISDAGITYSAGYSCNNVKNMSGDTVASIGTAREETYKFALISTDLAAAKALIYASAASATVKSNNAELPEHAFVLDMALTDKKALRITIPRGKVTEIGDVTYVSTDVIKYEITIACMLDNDGYSHYEYTTETSSTT